MAGSPKINMPCIDLSTDRLRFYRQIGAEEVTLGSNASLDHDDFTTRITDRPVRPLVPPAQTGRGGGPGAPWDQDTLREQMARCASFGLQGTTMVLGLSGAILCGSTNTRTPPPPAQLDFQGSPLTHCSRFQCPSVIMTLKLSARTSVPRGASASERSPGTSPRCGPPRATVRDTAAAAAVLTCGTMTSGGYPASRFLTSHLARMMRCGSECSGHWTASCRRLRRLVLSWRCIRQTRPCPCTAASPRSASISRKSSGLLLATIVPPTHSSWTPELPRNGAKRLKR